MNEIVLSRKELSRNTKLTVLNAVMMPTLNVWVRDMEPDEAATIASTG